MIRRHLSRVHCYAKIFSPDATALLTDVSEIRLLLRAKLIVKIPSGGQNISGLPNYAATLELVYNDFVKRFSLPTRKSEA
jgi:hypothetical protein